MIAPLRQIINQALNFCLPARCLLCYELTTDAHGLCPGCWQGLDFISQPYCKTCGIPFEFKVEGELICGSCIDHPPVYDCARAAAVYKGTCRHLLLAFKHGDMLQAAKIISRWMKGAAKDFIQEADIIIPVPLHPMRLFWRQYNQAAILGNELSDLTGIPKMNTVLQRNRYTVSQGKKDFKDRKKNVKSAFMVNSKKADIIIGKNVLLVDDVMTTGATIEECTKTLKKAGANKVFVLTFARATRSKD